MIEKVREILTFILKMTNKTLKEFIENIRGNSQNYIRALKVGKELNLLDIPCKLNEEINDRTLEKEITIYFKPIENGMIYLKRKEDTQFMGDYVRQKFIKYTKKDGDNIFPLNIKDIGWKKNVIIGYYLKDINVIYIGYNPLDMENSYDWAIFKFYDMIKSLLKQTNIEVQDIKKAQMKILSKNFFSGITRRIKDMEDDASKNLDRVQRYEKDIMSYLKHNLDLDIQIEGLKVSSKDKENGFQKELDKLDNLSFLDKWEIEETNLVFHFKKVHALYKSKNVYMGDYKVTLMANSQFKWECDNKIKEQLFGGSKSPAIHPHIRGNDQYGQCWGEKAEEVRKAVVTGNYSLLVTYINLFLRTYNPNSPHVVIENWIEYNKKYNRSEENKNGDKK